jgi:RES domain-containing protein
MEIDMEDIPITFRYLEIDAPDSIEAQTADDAATRVSWRTGTATTQRAGDDWLRSGHTALLRVPSVMVPATWNVLINPQHPESAGMRIVQVHEYPIDPRLRR